MVTLDTGLTWSPVDNLQWDAGVFIGLTPAATRVQPFVGLTQRF